MYSHVKKVVDQVLKSSQHVPSYHGFRSRMDSPINITKLQLPHPLSAPLLIRPRIRAVMVMGVEFLVTLILIVLAEIVVEDQVLDALLLFLLSLLLLLHSNSKVRVRRQFNGAGL